MNYTISPSHTTHYYAKLAVSSSTATEGTVMTHCTDPQRVVQAEWT